MGSWGAGLYSGDFASDLRSTIRAVVRLPFEPDRLLDIVMSTEPTAALNPEDDDYSTFWLVVADRFARCGIKSDPALETALRIIDSGQDLETQRRLGQTASGLEKRRRVLSEVRDRIVNPATVDTRKTIRKPQPYVMGVGDVLAYPICGGDCRNPYATRPDQLKIYGPGGGQPWTQDAWAATIIVERGLTFGFFAWYRPLVVRAAYDARPTLAELTDAQWALQLPGTCSATHFRRIGFEIVGTVPVSHAKLETRYPTLQPGTSAAISDISIANRLKVWSVNRMRPISPALQERLVRVGDLIA